MKLVILKTFDNPYEAYLVKSKIESEDIACYIFDDNVIGLNPLYSTAFGGIKLKVNDYDYEKAKKIVEDSFERELTDDTDEVLICPKCNSDKIYSGFKSVKNIRGILSMILSFIFSTYPLYFKTLYKCKNCNHEFKKA